MELWLCYLLSAGDHRLSTVEKWAEQHLELLADLSSQDFSDDKLPLLLGYLSDDSCWRTTELGKKSAS